MINRRDFLKWTGALATLGSAGTGSLPAAKLRTPGVYRELGVRPFLNAAGTYTALSGSIMHEEVIKAMEQAGQAHVSIAELQEAFSRRVAAWLGCEAALVTAGCAAALTLATAACVAGKDPEKIRRIPDTTGMKDEVIFQKSHRFAYDHAIRNVGVKIIEVETREELEAGISERTALLFFLNLAEQRGKIGREEFARIANRRRIPCLIDAAADLPPLSNLRDLIRMGYDLAAFSGGKGLQGPQCSGLLIGKKELIEAAFLNGPPHSDSVGRGAKVGKEEIAGLYRALQLYIQADHSRQWREWERQVEVVERELRKISGVRTERFVPEIANHSPHLRIRWDQQTLSRTPRDIVEALRRGEPRIELRPGSADSQDGIELSVWMLARGEGKILARRLRQVLSISD